MAAFASNLGGMSTIEQAIRSQAPVTMQQTPASAGYDPTVIPPATPMPQGQSVGQQPTQGQMPQTQNEETMLILKALTDRLKSNTKSQEAQAPAI